MSFYTSLNGLKNAQSSLGTIAHNIANSETYGFKRGRTEFAEIVAGSGNANPRTIQGIGASVEAITQNFALGPIEQTGSALDVAITGDGFFTLRGENGETLYTRAGSFTINETGGIVDTNGNGLQVYPVNPDGTASSNTLQNAQIPATNAAGAEYAGVSVGKDGVVTGLKCVRADWSEGQLKEVPDSEFTLPADLILLAMGFLGPRQQGMIEQSGVTLTDRGNVDANVKDYRTSDPAIYACGDMRRGQSLVVWAIREGRQCAASVDEALMGKTELPR